jgi:rfaE bifunctional protein kinase chain/domain
MTRGGLESLLADIRKVRVALVGDFALDAYWFIDMAKSEPSLETGLNTRPISIQRYSLGGAGNIAANLSALGCPRVHALGVVGRDPFAGELVRRLDGHGVDTSGLVVQEKDWATPVFIKPHSGNREINRIDTADYNRLSRATIDRLFRNLVRLLPRVDIVVVNQQIKDSLHCARFRRRMAEFIRRHPRRLILADTRDYGHAYRAAALKVNEHEAVRLCGMRGGKVLAKLRVEMAARTLFAKSGRPVFVTRGRKGCLVADQAGLHEVPAIRVRGKTDTVGAGDSTLAGIALALATGKTPVVAAELGNLAATVTIRKLHQTGTASPDEIRKAWRSSS